MLCFGYERRVRRVGLNIRFDTMSREPELGLHAEVTYSKIIAEQHPRVQTGNYI